MHKQGELGCLWVESVGGNLAFRFDVQFLQIEIVLLEWTFSFEEKVFHEGLCGGIKNKLFNINAPISLF